MKPPVDATTSVLPDALGRGGDSGMVSVSTLSFTSAFTMITPVGRLNGDKPEKVVFVSQDDPAA